MNMKKGLIIGATAAIGASLGSITTALIMTRGCHNMMEQNKKDNEEIKKSVEELKANTKVAERAFSTYKEKVQFCDKEAKEMYEAITEGFRGLAQEGKTHQENLKKVSDKAIELMGKEFREMAKELKEMINNEDKVDNEDKSDEDITQKMIDQIDGDTGRTTHKRK